MPWLKAGDTADEHPIVMRVLGETRDWLLLNAVFGFVMRCAIHAAGHTTDYFISDGVVLARGGPETERLAELAKKAGYWKRVRVGGEGGWKLVDHPEFIHMRLRSELDWEKQQRADVRNTALTVPVRLRDGDACRYCGHVVTEHTSDKRSGRRLTYDHRRPGEAARGPEDLVVSCGSCNYGRRDHPDADEKYPLQPPPAVPYYHRATAAWLAKHGHHVVASDDRPDGQSGTERDPAAGGAPRTKHAERDPASGGSTRAAPPAHGEAEPPIAPVLPLAPRDPAAGGSTRSPDLPDPADRLPDGSGFAGSGRDRVGSGSGHGSGSGGRPPPPERRRSRRGARGRPRTGGSR